MSYFLFVSPTFWQKTIVNERNSPFPASPFLFFRTLREPKKKKLNLPPLLSSYFYLSFISKALSVPNTCTQSAPLRRSVAGEREKRGKRSSVGGLVCDRGTGKKWRNKQSTVTDEKGEGRYKARTGTSFSDYWLVVRNSIDLATSLIPVFLVSPEFDLRSKFYLIYISYQWQQNLHLLQKFQPHKLHTIIYKRPVKLKGTKIKK